MKPRIYALITGLLIMIVGFGAYNTVTADDIDTGVAEHVHPDTPIPSFAADVVEFSDLTTPAEAAILRPDLFAPDLAKSCYIHPDRGSWVKATCQAYSGSGSRGFQVVGWAWNGCKTYIKIYGSIGSAPTRSSYIPSSGAGTFLPYPWTIVSSWIIKS